MRPCPARVWLRYPAVLAFAGFTACVIPPEVSQDEEAWATGSGTGEDPHRVGPDEPGGCQSERCERNPPESDTTGGAQTFVCQKAENDSLLILEKRCRVCHGPHSNLGNFGYVTDVEQLIERGLLVPGEPESSILYNQMATDQMPPSTAEPLQPQELSLIHDWIHDCLEPLPEGEEEGTGGSDTGGSDSGTGGELPDTDTDDTP